MPKLRVLTLLHSLSLTGAPKIALDACDVMREDIDTFFLALGEGPLSERCQQIGPLCIIPGYHQIAVRGSETISGKSIKRVIRGARSAWAKIFFSRLQRQIKNWKPEVIYVNSVASLNFFKMLDLPNVPLLLHVHELDVEIKLNIGDDNPLLTMKPDKYIAVSEPVKNLLTGRLGIEENLITLIHEFVPEADFQQPLPNADERIDDRFVVGGAGHPGWRKGTTLWLQMAVELKKMMGEDRVHFVWVGVSDAYESIYFQEEARKFKLENLIEFVPANKTPLRHYTGFDVFAMTSLEDPCPLVVLENMMLEKPVVCFADSGGAPEEVGSSGIVIEDFNPKAMAVSIAELASEPERRKVLGKMARERVTAHFTTRTQVPKILKELQTLALKKIDNG